MKFRVKAKWNDEWFDRIFECEDELDCFGHIHFWASCANARITELTMVKIDDDHTEGVLGMVEKEND